MKHGWTVGAAVMVIAGCAKAVQVAPEAPKAERYRPSWTASVRVHLDDARACLEGREEPRFVAYIEPLATGAVGVTTIDAFGTVEHCAYAGGRVLRREAAELRGRELGGLPLLALGAEPPTLPVGEVAEEVLDEDRVVGWLFWPPRPDLGTDEGGEP